MLKSLLKGACADTKIDYQFKHIQNSINDPLQNATRGLPQIVRGTCTESKEWCIIDTMSTCAESPTTMYDVIQHK